MKHRHTCPRAALAVLLAMTAATASATPCDEVINSINGKLQARGITGYTLEAIPREQAEHQRVVGSCDVGLKKIIYQRTVATAPAAAPAGTAVAQIGSPVSTTAPAATAEK